MNVADLDALFDDGADVTLEILSTAVLTGIYDEVKILGNGELTKKLNVSAHRFSKSAEEKIKSAGGQVNVVKPKRTPDERQAAIKAGELSVEKKRKKK